MIKVVNIHEAKTHLSRLIEEVLAGEEVTIAKAGVPLIDLSIHRGVKRQFGIFKDVWPTVPNEILMQSDSEELESHETTMNEVW